MTALMEWVEQQTAQAESAPEALALLCSVTKQTQHKLQITNTSKLDDYRRIQGRFCYTITNKRPSIVNHKPQAGVIPNDKVGDAHKKNLN